MRTSIISFWPQIGYSYEQYCSQLPVIQWLLSGCGDMKKVSVRFGLATAIISDVILSIRPMTGIVRRNPKILS